MKILLIVTLVFSSLSGFASNNSELKCEMLIAYGEIADDLEVNVLEYGELKNINGEKTATMTHKGNEMRAIVKTIPPYYAIRSYFNKKLINESAHKLEDLGVSNSYSYDESGKAYVLQVECKKPSDI